MKKVGVILLSGGLDSTTAASWACRQRFDLTALTLDYAQAHRREVDAATKVAEALGIKQHIVDVSSFSKLAWYSALTSPSEFSAPHVRTVDEMAVGIPNTYVPMRNTFFLALAAAALESRCLSLIEHDEQEPRGLRASLIIAANAV